MLGSSIDRLINPTCTQSRDDRLLVSASSSSDEAASLQQLTMVGIRSRFESAQLATDNVLHALHDARRAISTDSCADPCSLMQQQAIRMTAVFQTGSDQWAAVRKAAAAAHGKLRDFQDARISQILESMQRATIQFMNLLEETKSSQVQYQENLREILNRIESDEVALDTAAKSAHEARGREVGILVVCHLLTRLCHGARLIGTNFQGASTLLLAPIFLPLLR